MNFVNAENFNIELKDSYVPGEELSFKVMNLDNPLDSQEYHYTIENYYTEIMDEGNAKISQEVSYLLPPDSVQGLWRINIDYKDSEVQKLFSIGKLEKASITMDRDIVTFKNIGNVPYDRIVLIQIGNDNRAMHITMEQNEVKQLKLSAPRGAYDIKINDGTNDQDLVFKNVLLQGDEISLETITGHYLSIDSDAKSLLNISIVFTIIVVFFLIVQFNIARQEKKN